jgi:hypothetical protein
MTAHSKTLRDGLSVWLIGGLVYIVMLAIIAIGGILYRISIGCAVSAAFFNASRAFLLMNQRASGGLAAGSYSPRQKASVDRGRAAI